MKKRILSLILALLLCLPTLSCSESGSADDGEAKESDMQVSVPEPGETEEETEADPLAHLPTGIDYGGYDIRFLSGFEEISLQLGEEDDTGDIVNDAYWRRNKQLEERLKVTLSLPQAADHLAFSTKAQQAVAAGTNDYQVFCGHTRHHVGIAASGYLMNLNDAGAMDIIDFSRPYWNQAYTENINYKDNLFWLSGDLTHNVIAYLYCIFVNAALLENYHTGMNIYDIVFEGDWTLDKMAELSEGVYRDLNGDGKRDRSDQYAVIMQQGHTLNGLFFAGGVTFTGTDEEGNYKIVLNSEHTVNLFEKIHNMFYKNENNAMYTNAEYADLSEAQFTKDKVLFCPQMFQFAGTDRVRSMETDFYVIPMPKFDASQENYRSLQWDGLPIYGIPTSLPVDEIEMVATVLEVDCALTSEIVMPAYYDVALKNKYSRDPVAAQMMDIIKSNVTSDFAYLWGDSISNLLEFLFTAIPSENIASQLKTGEKMWGKLLSRLIEKLENVSD